MTTQKRKKRLTYSPAQKLEYAKLMVDDGYSVKQIMEISGAGETAVNRWKKQYLSEIKGEFVAGKIPLDAEQRRIRELEIELAEAREDIRLLKKATALFIRDNPNLR
jgi:transposase